MTTDAPAAAPGRAPRALAALALVAASGGCCWAMLPPFLRLWRAGTKVVVRETTKGLRITPSP